MKNIHDATLRNAAVIELQEKILSTQETQAALVDRIRELEKQVADFETWNTEKNQYELKDLGWNAFAHMLKPNARGAEPPHWACTHCYKNRRIEIIQHTTLPSGQRGGFVCPRCHNEIRPSHHALDGGKIKWLDD